MAAHEPGERLEVGSIGKAHGLRGEVQVRLTTDRDERLDPGSVLYTDDRSLVVGSSRPHQNGWLVRFDGVDDRTAAEALRGVVLRADPIEDPDTLWVHELIGARIVETGGADRGSVEERPGQPGQRLAGPRVRCTGAIDVRGGLHRRRRHR